MMIDHVATFVESLSDVLTLRPSKGDGSPEVAWGDVFFYYAPDGVLPPGQPFATIVTKDYPDDPPSDLGPGEFRVNIDAGRRGQEPVEDPTVRDTVIPHPVYGDFGWVCIVQPGPNTTTELHALIQQAHQAAQRRWNRRHS
jgi:hypothetical protein